MQTFELLKESLLLAESLGYGIRHEWLGGAGGGRCEIAGRKWLFVDISLNPVEQLDQVVQALLEDPQLPTARFNVSASLGEYLGVRRCA